VFTEVLKSWVTLRYWQKFYGVMFMPRKAKCQWLSFQCTNRLGKTNCLLPHCTYLVFLKKELATNAFIIDFLWKKIPGNMENSLSLQRELKTATMVYTCKSLNGLAPDYLKSMFTDWSSTSTYSLRNCESKLALPLPHTKFLKSSFSYSSVVLWNSSPIPICGKHKRLLLFKSGCKGFLFDTD